MRYLRAESIRSRGSVLWWLALSGLLLGLVLTVLALSGSIEDASDVLGWQALLVTGMAAPLAVLFAGLAEVRERDSRAGGTAWRPVAEHTTRLFRLVVVWLALGLFFMLDFGVTAVVAAVFGLDGAGTVVLIGFFVWIGALGPAGLGAAASRRYGLLPTLLAAAVWQIGLGFFVERDWWWFNPAAWPLRLVLPSMGLHFNALPLEPDSPLQGESPWPAFALCLLLAIIGAGCAVAAPERTRTRRQAHTSHVVCAPVKAGPAVERPGTVGPGAALRGIARSAMTPAVNVCIALTVLAILFSMRYGPDVRHILFSFLILPVGAGILPVLVWPRLQPAWALMQVEHARVRTALCAWCAGVVGFVALVAALTGGGGVHEEARRFILSLLVGIALVLFSLVVTARLGIGWALALTIVGTIFSLTIGGDVLAASPLWILAVPAWPHVAQSPLRFAVAGVLALILVLVAWVLACRKVAGLRAV